MSDEVSVTDEGPEEMDMILRCSTLRDTPEADEWLHGVVSLFPGVVIAIDTSEVSADNPSVQVVLAAHGAAFQKDDVMALLRDVLDCLEAGDVVLDEEEGNGADD